MKFQVFLPLALLVLGTSLSRASTTFSFINDVWTNGGNTQTGYLNGASAGTLTKAGLTMTFQSSFTGTAIAATRNLTLDNGNPTGFVLGTNADANNLSGILTNYQRWDFSFTQPVLINSLIIDDIDSDRDPLPVVGGFRDAIAAEDVDGKSLLHNSMIVYGGCIADGNRHNHDDLPIVLAGHGGGAFKPGRHVELGENVPLANLYLRMLEEMGVNEKRFGDSSGVLKKV